MASLRGTRIGIIGAGAIGGVVIDRLLAGAACRAEDIVACETQEPRRQHIASRFGVRVGADPADAAGAQLVVVAVPPLEVTKVLAAIRDRLGHHPVIISFAGAVPLAVLEAALPPGTPVVRVNPNSPSLVGRGFNPVAYGAMATGAARALADRFLDALGAHPEVPDETMNLYTALSAVGPTYFLPVLDAMIAAGLKGGLSREAAVAAAVETALGTAAMVGQRPEEPEQLKLCTGLRPLKDAEARELVAQAIAEALSRMAGVQQKVTSAS